MEIAGFGMINANDNLLNDYRLKDYRATASRALNAPRNFQDILEKTRMSDNSEQRPAGKDQKIDKDDKLYQLCLELETFLVKNLLSSMRDTVQKSGLVDDSFAGKMYEDMLYDEYAKDFTKNAGFGLAEQAYKQLINHRM